jgi:hypothetical protein
MVYVTLAGWGELMATRKQRPARSFKTAERSEIPTGRNGKHKDIVTHILNDLEGLESGLCLKIPLEELPDTKVNIRSALNRATRKLDKTVATAADDLYLYVWNV